MAGGQLGSKSITAAAWLVGLAARVLNTGEGGRERERRRDDVHEGRTQ